MINYIKNNPVNIVFAAIFVLAFGVTTYFLASSNRNLRQENREKKRENKELKEENTLLKSKNDSIISEVNERDEVIKKSTVVYDSLRTKLNELNNKNIVTNYEAYSTVTSLDLDDQIKLLSEYISKADSISR